MKTKLILEIGYCHNGSYQTAKQMIEEAANIGVWGVKLQKWDVDGLPDEIKAKKRTDKHAYGATYYDHRKYLEFNIQQIMYLKDYAESLGLVFIMSGKDFKSIRILVEKGIRFIKLPSQRLFDNDIYRYLVKRKAEKKLFIMVSSGMIEEKELSKTSWPKWSDVFFHCVSLYPAEAPECQLSIISRHKFINGYSSHENDGVAIPLAVAMGAEYIERHFTLDKTQKGTDHSLSSTPEDIRNLIRYIEDVEMITGGNYRELTTKERSVRDFYRSF